MNIKIVKICCCIMIILAAMPSLTAIEIIKNLSNNNKCVNSFEIFTNSNLDPFLIKKLVSPSGKNDDFFGYSISMVNDMLWVGSPQDDTGGNNSGAVYTYIKNETSWINRDIILSDNMTKNLGYSIAVDPDNSNVVVIGSPGSGVNETGAVNVFYLDSSGQWIEQEKINPPAGTPENSRFGSAVDIDNNIMIIGAPAECNIIGAFVGNVYIYERDINGNWIFKQKLSPVSVCDGAFFGSSILINDDTIFVGAPYVQPDAGFGKVFVFNRLANSWYLEQTLTATVPIPNDRFGSSIDISGDNLAIGSSRHGCLPAFGQVYLFDYESNWIPKQFFPAPNQTYNDGFGSELAMNENHLIVSAPNHDNKGAVFLYDIIVEEAVFNTTITSSDSVNLDSYGSSLALSNINIAIGAFLHDTIAENDGAVYIYESHLPPNKPSITGPTSGIVGEKHNFTFFSFDLNNDDIYYYIDWGEGNNSEWIGPFNSSEEICIKHCWNENGFYSIKAKAKDINNMESDLNYLEIKIPKNKTTYNYIYLFLQRFFEIFPRLFPKIQQFLGIF